MHELKPAEGSQKAKTSCRSWYRFRHGQGIYSWYQGSVLQNWRRHRPGFEGGQMPLYRRLPKRGFKNTFAKYAEK